MSLVRATRDIDGSQTNYAYPTGTVVGDTVFVLHQKTTADGGLPSIPTGFTFLSFNFFTRSGAQSQSRLDYRVVTNVSDIVALDTLQRGVILSTISGILGAGGGMADTPIPSTTVNVAGITTTVLDSSVFLFAVAGGALIASPPTGYTSVRYYFSGSFDFYIAFRDYGVVGPTGTVVANTNGSGSESGAFGLTEVKPGASGGAAGLWEA